MADVRGASGVPGVGAFGGQSAASPSTPIYIDLSNGDVYALINETVTLIGSIAGGSNYIIANQSMGKHVSAPTDLADAGAVLAMRSFAERDYAPQAVMGDASDILGARAFSPRPLPAMWS